MFFVHSDSGFTVKTYRYYQPSTRGFDFKGCLEDINVIFLTGFSLAYFIL